MFKITRAARQILKSTSNIKAFTLSSIKAIEQYLNPSVIAKVKGTTKLHEKGTKEFGVT